MDLILLPLFSWLPMYSFHGPRAARPPFLRCERKYPFTVGSSVAALAVVPGQLVELIDEGVADPRVECMICHIRIFFQRGSV